MAKSRRSVASWLASPRVAAMLLLVVGIWSFIGTIVPQGDAKSSAVAEWATAHPIGEMLAQTFSLHQAFSSPIFVVIVLLLAASTMVCAWRRTKVAIRRSRLLRDMTDDDARQLAARPTFSVDMASADAPEPAAAVSGAFRGMGLRVQERDGMVVGVSRPWAVFASPLFHWGLFALILVIFVVQMTRAEGLIGVPVRDSRPLVEDSFGLLDRGALYSFERPPLVIRVDKIDREYVVDDIDRGPAPTVVIVRPDSSVAASQVVYPNNAMRFGSLMIHAGEIGLSPGFALVSKEGVVGERVNLIVDYDVTNPTGTTSAEFTLDTARADEPAISGSVTILLEQAETSADSPAPVVPRARFVLRAEGDGSVVADKTLAVGEEIELPNGLRLRLLGVENYARLSVVDDPSIPLVYALLAVTLAAVTVSILGRQSLAVAAVRLDDDGSRRVDVWFRDWRANKIRTEQAQEAVRDALSVQAPTNGDAE